jgi:hypothetical protein
MRLLTVQSGLSQNPPVIAVIAGYAIELAARHSKICRLMAVPLQNTKCPGSGKSMQTLNLSNLIATCIKLLHFANCAYLKLGCAARKHYIASMANGMEHDETHEWIE